MLRTLLKQLSEVLIDLISEDLIKRVADSLFDIAEKAIADTESDVDDALIAPLLAKIRAAFNVPDNDEMKKNDSEKTDDMGD